jgi:D-amino-acid dehydrogenase
MSTDVIVLGAGIVGVCSALHLQDRGMRVVLVDRRGPGEETSFGNAGLIQSASVVPYGFPRDVGTVLRYARNASTSTRYDFVSLLRFAPWLARYWWESAPERLARAGRDLLPLITTSVREHDMLIDRAGLHHLVRPSGWLEAYRTEAVFAREARVAADLAGKHELAMRILDAVALRAAESALGHGYVGAIHWLDPKTVSDPGALTKGYARLFRQGGGSIERGDAMTLERREGGWCVRTERGVCTAPAAVLALGPWSDRVYRKLGYRIPLMPKRGYHMHYAGREQQPMLKLPVIDTEEGFAIAPMARGLRLSTGVEIARRGLPPTPVQLERAERKARPIFGLGDRVDKTPWVGMRPCTPDMRPVIGPAPRHLGLWFSFGHNHHGLTLGPGSGRLLAELMTGATPFADPRPFRPSRFA